MLFYHGRGLRDYQESPHTIKSRIHWEWACILSGRSSPSLLDSTVIDDSPAIWLFPPKYPHGWQGRGPSDVCIVHLAHCSRLIANYVEQIGYLRIPLSTKDITQIRQLDSSVAQMLKQWPESKEIAADRFRGLFESLSLPHIQAVGSVAQQEHERTVRVLISWLNDHLEEGAGINEAAEALAISPGHLRRLCHQVAGRSPRDLLTELRLNRAKDLLTQSNDSIEHIAWKSGYGSAVALSQVFVRHFTIRPGAWRKIHHRDNDQAVE